MAANPRIAKRAEQLHIPIEHLTPAVRDAVESIGKIGQRKRIGTAELATGLIFAGAGVPMMLQAKPVPAGALALIGADVAIHGAIDLHDTSKPQHKAHDKILEHLTAGTAVRPNHVEEHGLFHTPMVTGNTIRRKYGAYIVDHKGLTLVPRADAEKLRARLLAKINGAKKIA